MRFLPLERNLFQTIPKADEQLGELIMGIPRREDSTCCTK